MTGGMQHRPPAEWIESLTRNKASYMPTARSSGQVCSQPFAATRLVTMDRFAPWNPGVGRMTKPNRSSNPNGAQNWQPRPSDCRTATAVASGQCRIASPLDV